MNSYSGVVFVFIFLYLVPGLSLSRFFEGRLKNSPFFVLFLSFLLLPLEYTFLINFDQLTFPAFIFLELMILGASFALNRRRSVTQKVDLDRLFPPFSCSPVILVSATIFFFLVMSPRLGLWQGFFPIGDDQHQIRKTVSVAESPGAPLFYHFPTTKLTIYYFNNVAPGLWVKFSENFVKANQAWFIHVALQTILILWLIVRVGGSLFSNHFSRYIFFFCLTFFSGFEFFLYLLKSPGYLNQLEWWSDWFWPSSQIHLQISNPFTLFFWVPQHLMAALFVLAVFLVMRSTERQKPLSQVFLAFLWANILGNSAFVFLTTVFVYALHQILEVTRTRNWLGTIRLNVVVVALSLIFSVNNLILFLTAEKGHYLVPMANVFWFTNNSVWWGKLINFSLTIPIYFSIELGVLFFVLIYALVRFFKDPEFKNKYLFFYLFVFLWPIIFLVKALDDNNISMRAFIPAQIALAIFVAELAGGFRISKIFLTILLIGFLLSLPSGLFDFSLRFREQFSGLGENDKSFYQALDRDLPLNSIVLAPYSDVDKVSALGHRQSFKDPKLFNATDREHTAYSQVERFSGLDFSQGASLEKLINAYPDLPKQYQFYSLKEINGDRIKRIKFSLEGRKEFSIFSLKIEP